MASPQPGSSFSLLIVEDDKSSCEIIARMVGLHFPQGQIHTAENGKKGLRLYKEHLHDIVITDINMPEMNGIEMAREIRALNTDATFIVLTAYGDREYFDKFTEIGYCAYLRKPINFGELFSMIEKCNEERGLA